MGMLEDIIARSGPFAGTGPTPGMPIDEEALAKLLQYGQKRAPAEAAPGVPFGALGAGMDSAAALAPPTAPIDGPIPLPRERPKEADGAPSVPVPTDVSSVNQPPIAPQNIQPPVPPAAAPEQPSIFGRLMSGLQNNSNTLLALGAGFAGAPNVGAGISRAASAAIPATQVDLKNRMMLEGQNMTFNALRKRGLPEDVAKAAMLNPEILKQVLPAVFGSKEFGFQMTPDGTLIRTDKGSGTVAPVYQSSKPQFSVIGKDTNGNDVHGFVDTATKKAWDVNGNPIDTAKLASIGGGANSTLTGPAFLETLDQGRANQIKAIADGRMSPPGGMSLKSPQIQGLMRDVAQYEPGFDLTSWTARNKTRADLASGKMGQNVTAFNTAIGHLETLDKAAEELNNYKFTPLNTVANIIKSKTGDPAIKNFEVARTAVADELTRAFRGSGGNVHDLIQWESAINAANSPGQLKAAVKQAVELLRSRIEAVGDQYSKGMGKTTDPLELLSPKAKAGIQRLMGEKAEAAAPKPDAAPGKAPEAGTVKDGYRFKGGNPADKANWEKV